MTGTIWRRLVLLGFRLLYNELAWLYNPVSWAASLGRWRKWQRSIWSYLPPAGRILEVGFGPGHLLVDLARAGYWPMGLDLSPAMLRQARRMLLKLRLAVSLCRGRAEALPFAAQAFDAVILTFPTDFVYDPAWLRELARVLKPSGRVIVAEMTSFDVHTPRFRFLEWLYHITGQRGSGPDLTKLFGSVGLVARRETIAVDGTSVGLVVAERPPGSAAGVPSQAQ
jgi:ubiquinone/menaquinone biosynthesis C-methylase UbiE